MPHIVKSFDDELKQLTALIAEMGGRVEKQLFQALKALTMRDSEMAQQAVGSDKNIDHLEHEIADFAVKILARRQPMAQDLREVVAVIKISSDLERIGDYAKNIAKRALILNELSPLKPISSIPRIGKLAGDIVAQVIGAYVAKDMDRAVAAWRQDEEIDAMYASLFREMLTYMMEDPRNIGPCTHLLFIAKNIERIGDHATNIAEIVHYLITGKNLEEERPKRDNTNLNIGMNE